MDPAHTGNSVIGVLTFTLRRLVAGWLGLALLLADVAVAPAIAEAPSSDLTAICTLGGIRHADPASSEDGAVPDGFCVFCLPLIHSGGAHQPGEFALATPPALARSLSRPHSWDRPVLRRFAALPMARGPPAI